jgi:hypothetical protein
MIFRFSRTPDPHSSLSPSLFETLFLTISLSLSLSPLPLPLPPSIPLSFSAPFSLAWLLSPLSPLLPLRPFPPSPSSFPERGSQSSRRRRQSSGGVIKVCSDAACRSGDRESERDGEGREGRGEGVRGGRGSGVYSDAACRSFPAQRPALLAPGAPPHVESLRPRCPCRSVLWRVPMPRCAALPCCLVRPCCPGRADRVSDWAGEIERGCYERV